MDKIKPLFAATATATGGRNGHTEASDGSVAANLSVPKEMGVAAATTGSTIRRNALRSAIPHILAATTNPTRNQHGSLPRSITH